MFERFKIDWLFTSYATTIETDTIGEFESLEDSDNEW